MIHVSCDRCKRMLDPEEDSRYVVRIEIYAAMEPLELDDLDDDRDHLMEIQDMLEALDDDESNAIGDQAHRNRQFDLCGDCYREYVKNPLGREVPLQFGFSEN